MSTIPHSLMAIYVDGETKTGKGTASQAIATALKDEGLNVYYDVAGDFFRRYVALVRIELKLDETDPLPTGPALAETARNVYERGKMFAPDDTLGDLQRPAISTSVSILGELGLAQRAGGEWWAMSIRNAVVAGATVIVLDGRNPRARVRDQLANVDATIRVVLDLYLTCNAEEAARRTLLGQGVSLPTPEQIAAECQTVTNRRERDRQRAEKPFVVPNKTIDFSLAEITPNLVLEEAWQPHDGAELPITISLDNTHLPKPEMLDAVSELAVAAVEFTSRKVI